MDKYICVYNSG